MKQLEIQRYHSRITRLPPTHPAVMLYAQEQRLLTIPINTVNMHINNIYPFMPTQVSSVAAKWAVQLPISSALVRSSSRSQVVSAWNACDSGTALKALYYHHSTLPSSTPKYLTRLSTCSMYTCTTTLRPHQAQQLHSTLLTTHPLSLSSKM